MKNPTILVIGLLVLLFVGFLLLRAFSSQEVVETPIYATLPSGVVSVNPVSHASFIMRLGDKTIFSDPVGELDEYEAANSPHIILLTDIHEDHLDVEVLNEVADSGTVLIAPQAVYDELPEALQAQTVVMGNGDQHLVMDVGIEAMPMYNLPESEDAYHVRGRGNGYLLTQADTRVYIAGDTSDIPEMRALEKIDYALIPMNLPYTMDVDVAADAVLDFAPAVVYPYHYRGEDGLSDVDEFERLVSGRNPAVDVRLLDWYPDQE